MNIRNLFGINLRKYRNQLGISQERLAELSGLHRTYISDVERFQRSISLDNIQKLAEALCIEPYLLFVNDEYNED